MAIVAIQECAYGNDKVGDMWLQTKVFESSEPIWKVIKWAKKLRCHGGKLIICEPDNAEDIVIGGVMDDQNT